MGHHDYSQVPNAVRRPIDGLFKGELITSNPKLKLVQRVREVMGL